MGLSHLYFMMAEKTKQENNNSRINCLGLFIFTILKNKVDLNFNLKTECWKVERFYFKYCLRCNLTFTVHNLYKGVGVALSGNSHQIVENEPSSISNQADNENSTRDDEVLSQSAH